MYSGIVTGDSGRSGKSVTFERNERSRSAGTAGHVQAESVVTLVRNTHLGIHLLEKDQVVIDGVRFLGTTLWTDFEVEEPEHTASFSMWYANQRMTDFSIIRYQGGMLHAEETREFHRVSRRWLSDRLAEPFDGKTVVVTHHLPHKGSIDRQFHRDPLNGAFASHMPELVRPPVDLWIHGHTHCSCDYEPAEGTRVVCNPRGYGPSDLNEQFNQYLVVEV